MDKLNRDLNYTVYMHTSPSGKIYIGITRTKPEKRWGKDGAGYKTQQYFWRAIQKYGWDNFKHEILYEHMTKSEAENMEIKLIAQYRSNQKEFGYNIENGGNSIGKISDETRKKISEANKGKVSPNKGKSMSEEQKRKISENKIGKSNGPRSEDTKRKISESNKGKTVSDETRKKLSEIRKECWKDENYRQNQIEKHKWQTGENHPFYGKHHSEETKKKISDAHKGTTLSEGVKKKLSMANSGVNNPFYGKKHSEESLRKMSESKQGCNNAFAKMIVQLDKENKLIRIWGCGTQASKELNVNYSSIHACCRGDQKTAGSYRWLYVYDQIRRNGDIIKGAISLGYTTEEDIKCLKF